MALDWDDFKYFTAVARAGSVRGAARSLDVHPSTVMRRLDHFERRLGTRLFARSGAGLLITDEGQAVIRILDEVADRIAEVEQQLKGRNSEVAGEVRINVPDVISADLFVPALGRLLAEQPRLEVRLTRCWELPDLGAHEADIALAVTNDPPDHLVGRPLGTMTLTAYGRADGAQRWFTSSVEASIGFQVPPLSAGWPRSHLQSLDSQVAAAVSGAGATLLPDYVASEYPQLVPLTPEQTRIRTWLLLRPDARGVARLQAVAEAVMSALQQHPLELPGPVPGVAG